MNRDCSCMFLWFPSPHAVCRNMQMHTWRSSKVINCAVTLVIASYVCAFAELNLLQLLGADPMGSLVLVRCRPLAGWLTTYHLPRLSTDNWAVQARRGCHSLAAVAKTTSPMKSIARAGGVIFGSGAGVALRQRFSRRHSVLVKGGMGVHSVLVKGGMGVLMRATLTCTALAYAMDAALVAATPDDERLHNAYAVLHNVVLYFMLTWMVPALVVSAERSYRQGVCAPYSACVEGGQSVSVT
jgi:hypothetical protein